ncbi:MAG: ATP-binding protein [Erysipelotrichaceae bacterium]
MNEKINRPLYLNKLVEFKDKDVVKIVTGIRRCGKSTLLELFVDYLLKNGEKKDNIIYMNLESIKFHTLNDYLPFYEFVSSKIVKGEKNYLIFDELQSVNKWEKAIESFRLDFDVDIYITGSNAYLLSSEFSTLLSGRYVEIRLLPLSFSEFLTFYNFPLTTSIDEKFQKYLQFGGMPILKQFDFNTPRSNEALEGIYSTVILLDVLRRNNLTDQVLLNKLVRFLFDNVGNITSPNNISNNLFPQSSGKNKVSVASKTIEKYLEMLQNAFIIYPVSRYDIKGKQLLKTLGKNYIVDIGFRNMLLGYRNGDRGHILENVVYLELLRRDYRISIGKIDSNEIDFIAEKPEEKIYIQVCESLQGYEVQKRELRPLKMINDNYEKIILTMDHNYIKAYDGIKVINIIEFLLDPVTHKNR